MLLFKKIKINFTCQILGLDSDVDKIQILVSSCGYFIYLCNASLQRTIKLIYCDEKKNGA